MTIQDTIPKWYELYYSNGPKELFHRTLIREGYATVCVDNNYYMFASFRPEYTDRYYFRIKLKQKK